MPFFSYHELVDDWPVWVITVPCLVLGFGFLVWNALKAWRSEDEHHGS